MDTQKNADYAAELQRRFTELEQWALENWPDPDREIKRSDFDQARKEIFMIVANLYHENLGAPEPSEGGPQYINMNATPWP